MVTASVAPNAGWVTFRVRSDEDLHHAIWLMGLSYFRYALKTAVDPRKLFAEASQEVQLTSRFTPVLEQFMSSTKSEDLVEPLTV
jgi:hypothetical protein